MGDDHKRIKARAAWRSGITLIELLVAMVIAMIVLSLSLPAFVGMGRGRALRSTTHNVHAALSLTRQWAITHKRSTAFYYNNNPGAVTNCAYYTVTNAFDIVQSPRSLTKEIAFVPLVGSDGQVTFNSEGGLASGAPSVNVVLKDQKNVMRTLTINGITGRITVQ